MPEQPRYTITYAITYGSTISRPLRHTRLCNPTVRVQLQMLQSCCATCAGVTEILRIIKTVSEYLGTSSNTGWWS
jgi:hypothetical protein